MKPQSATSDRQVSELVDFIKSNMGEESDEILKLTIENQIICCYLVSEGLTSNFIANIKDILVYALPCREYSKKVITHQLVENGSPDWNISYFDYEMFTDELLLLGKLSEQEFDGKFWTVIPNQLEFRAIMEGKLQT